MSNSVTTVAIKNISRGLFGQTLKTLGFTRKGLHFYRPSADLYHCIHFQSSQWNTATSGQFTINLAVASPSLYQHWTGGSFPANPAVALWPVQQRLGLLSPKRCDIWWQVDTTSDFQRLGSEVLSVLSEFGLPFFTQFPDSESILIMIHEKQTLPGIAKAQLPLVEAMLLKDKNRTQEAGDCIRHALATAKVAGFKNTIMLVAKRLGLEADLVSEERV